LRFWGSVEWNSAQNAWNWDANFDVSTSKNSPPQPYVRIGTLGGGGQKLGPTRFGGVGEKALEDKDCSQRSNTPRILFGWVVFYFRRILWNCFVTLVRQERKQHARVNAAHFFYSISIFPSRVPYISYQSRNFSRERLCWILYQI
jgi:hypothetical protein